MFYKCPDPKAPTTNAASASMATLPKETAANYVHIGNSDNTTDIETAILSFHSTEDQTHGCCLTVRQQCMCSNQALLKAFVIQNQV